MSDDRKLGVVKPITDVDRRDALATLESLRMSIESGETVCFVAVGIDRQDGTQVWMGNSPPRKSALQVQGAISQLFLTFWQWAEFDEDDTDPPAA
jgi:hypothetical protein